MYKPFFLLNNDIEVMIISQLLWNSDSIHTCVYYLTNLVSNVDTNNSDMFFETIFFNYLTKQRKLYISVTLTELFWICFEILPSREETSLKVIEKYLLSTRTC